MVPAALAGKIVKEVIGVAFPVGMKLIEVGLPIIKQASQITFSFIQGGLNEVLKEDQSIKSQKIKLTKRLDIVEKDLSIPASFSDNQLKPMENQIGSDLNIVKGQNEMLFLSNSILYFIESHKNRIGLDRSISYALQYDIHAVREHLKTNREIRFPGYLLHQCVSLSETIKELNILYVSILDNGKVPTYTEETARKELYKRVGVINRQSKIRSYIPFELQFRILKEISDQYKNGKSEIDKVKNMFADKMPEYFKINMGLPEPELLGISIKDIDDKAHEALFILCEELMYNEELENLLEDKLKGCADNKLIIENYSEE